MNERLLQLLQDLEVPVTLGSLKVERGPVLEAAGLAGRMRAFAPEQGWLQFTDRVVLVEELDTDSLAHGRLLAAELVRDGVSLHLRWQPDGWHAWELHQVEGDDLLLQQDYIGTSRVVGRKLRYQTCWQINAAGVLAPALSRFVGFVQGGE